MILKVPFLGEQFPKVRTGLDVDNTNTTAHPMVPMDTFLDLYEKALGTYIRAVNYTLYFL